MASSHIIRDMLIVWICILSLCPGSTQASSTATTPAYMETTAEEQTPDAGQSIAEKTMKTTEKSVDNDEDKSDVDFGEEPTDTVENPAVDSKDESAAVDNKDESADVDKHEEFARGGETQQPAVAAKRNTNGQASRPQGWMSSLVLLALSAAVSVPTVN